MTPQIECAAKRHVTLGTICLAALVLPLSFAGGAIATPAIGRDLGGDPVVLNWITNAFMLTFGGFLLAAGTLADQFGRKRLFVLGILSFAVVSLVLSLAPSTIILDILRAVQGLAAAASLSAGSAALAQEFEGPSRIRAFSLLGTTFGAGLAGGPIIAGLLIEHLGWRTIFLSGAVIGALAMLGVPYLRETRDPDAAALDWAGALTFSGCLTLFTFGLLQAPESGWRSPLVIAALAGAAAMLVAFVIIETRATRPMLDLSLFRFPRFIGVQALPVATCCCYVLLLVLLPLRFIGIEGRSEVEAGYLLAFLSAPMLIVPFLAAMLARRVSPGILSGCGLMIAAAGLLWLGQIDPAAGGHDIVLPLLIIGLGTGLPWGLMDGLSVSVVPKERAGMATGIFSTVRVAGEGVALAIASVILTAITRSSLREQLGAASDSVARWARAAHSVAAGDVEHAARLLPDASRAVLVHGYATAFRGLVYVLIAVTVLSALAAFAFLRSAGSDTAARSRP